MSLTLTKNGIRELVDNQNRINENVLVQLLNVKASKNGKHFPCHISDGYVKIKAVLSCEKQKVCQEKHNFALIRIRQHSIIRSGDNIKGVQVQEFDLQHFYPELIGDPSIWGEQIEISSNADNHFDPDKIKPKNDKKKPIEIYEQEKPPVTLFIDDGEPEDITYITQNRLKQSDKISDLYVDLQNWQIICRITDLQFKQFISKRSNKFTQILTIEMMDRTGMKIEGTIFGEHAKKMSTELQLNGLYKISRGQIRQENYQTNKGPKFSRFNINFNVNSQFKLIHDTSLIPQFDQNNYLSVHQVFTQKDYQKQYDLVGIITEVGQLQEFNDKNGKPLSKRIISVSDPQNNETIEVTLWRDVKFDEDFKGKTCLLKNFKLNNYMNKVTLNSLFKSEIKVLENHRYRKYEQNLNTSALKPVSQIAPTIDHEKDCRNIKKLKTQIDYIENEPIFSSLNAYVSLISFKSKWYYESCPKCKKGGAESNTNCYHCGAMIEEPVSRFILPIEIADCTGSIWTTAFDEFASVILQGRDISVLKQLDEVKLREQGQKRIFQEFRFRISTKRQATGSIKHTIVGKPSQISPQKVTLENINRIYQYE